MRAAKLICLVLLAAIAFVPAAFAAAPVVHVLGAGSSALFQATAVAAVNDLAPTVPACAGGVGVSCSIHHYVLKNGGDCGTVVGGGCTELSDSRISGGVQPGLQGGNIWIAWVTCLVAADCPGYAVGADTDVWADVSVDSVVGVRTFLARAGGGGVATALQLTSNTTPAPLGAGTQAPDNNVNDLLFAYGDASATPHCTTAATCDAAHVPNDVYTALTSGASSVLTTGFTDIRAEDAKYATKRINKPFDTSSYFLGLGYSTAGSALVGNLIHSGVSAATAEPDNFALPGSSDPFNGQAVPTTITTFPIGEAPILFLVNRNAPSNTASDLGAENAGSTNFYYNNLVDNVKQPGGTYVTKLGKLFMGKDISGAAAAFWNTGVVGAAPPAGGFSGIPAGQTYTNEVAFIATNGIGGAGTFDIKIDPTLVAPPWGFACGVAGPAALADGSGIILSGTAAGGSAVNFDGVYQVVQYSGDNNGSCNKITVTAYGIPATLTDPAFTRYPPTCTLLPTTNCLNPEATVTWWTPNNFKLHLLVREPLSGTYNTTEFTSIREFGGPGQPGFGTTTFAPAKSQDADWTDDSQATANNLAATANPLSAHVGWFPPCLNFPPEPIPGQNPCPAIPGVADATMNGDRTRVIGTSEMVATVKATTNSLGYAFFSFGNVSSISASNLYSYLQLDGVDPIFANYVGDTGGYNDPGQPNFNTPLLLPGALPPCTFGATCDTHHIWKNGVAGCDGAGSVLGCSYPHLRDGTYRAWSLLRALCDTAHPSCTKASDPYGTEGLLAAAQVDIHCSGNPAGAPAFCSTHTIAGVPDFLPFDDAGLWNAGPGDAGFYRAHFTPGLFEDNNEIPFSSQIFYWTPAADPGGPIFGQDPANTPVEAGGDVGGCILPFPATNATLECEQ